MSREKVSKAIMFYYDSATGEYKPVDELSGADSLYKYIPKIELYWFDESDNGYKPLVTDGTLPLSGGGGVDASVLANYALKTYVNNSIDTLTNQIGSVYATQSYVTTEIGRVELSLDSTYLRITDADTTYAKKSYVDSSISTLSADISNEYMKKTEGGVDMTEVNNAIGNLNTSIGDLGGLTTIDKTSVISAINEVDANQKNASGTYAEKADLDTKVDKISGKQLSTEDYTSAEKTKLDGISAGANNYTLPVASSTVVGGVKVAVDTGLDVTGEGELSATTLKNSVDNHIADEDKHVSVADKAKWNTVGTASNLTTTVKTDLVSAINELKAQYGSGEGGGGSPVVGGNEINIKDYGAVGDGVADDTLAIQDALDFAMTNKNKVIIPSGRYKTTGTLTVYTGTSLEGLSAEGSVIEYNGNGAAVKFDYDMRDMAIRNFTIQSTNSSSTASVGVLMEANLFCNVDNIRVLDFDIGYKFDGKDKWCASNYVYNPFSLRCKTGMLLTADEGKQTNHTIVIGGYIVGYSPIQEGTEAIVIEQGDSNKFFGTAVEDYSVGYHFISENAGGNSLISPRVENCTKSYIVEPNTVNTTIIDPFGGVEEADIQSASFMFLSLEPTFVANNLIWENDKGIQFYSSGRTPWEIFKVTANDGLEFKTPSWFDSDIEFKVADEANMHQSELVVKQNEVNIRKYLKHGLTDELPVASSEYRGKEIMTQGITGQADKLMVCMKKEDGTYAWYSRNSYSESPHITDKKLLGLGKEFIAWFGDQITVGTYNITLPTIENQDTAVQLQGLQLVPSILDRLYVRFYIADKTKLSKISVKASNGLSSEFQRFPLSNGWNEVPLDFNLGTVTEGNITYLQFQVRGLNVGDDAGVILNSVGVIDKSNTATVSLQFDDALSSVYTEARKILRDNNIVGSIGVISSFVGNAGHMTEAQLKEMKMMGWSLFNHTASHINMSAYTKEQAILEVNTAKDYLDSVYGTGIESRYVAYPQGGLNENVKQGLKEVGMVGRGLSARDEIIPSSNKQDTCAFEINNSTTFEQAKAKIDLAIKHGTHITLLLHKVEATTTSTISTTTAILRSLAEYIRQKEDEKVIKVITTRDLAKLELEG